MKQQYKSIISLRECSGKKKTTTTNARGLGWQYDDVEWMRGVFAWMMLLVILLLIFLFK